MHVSPRCFISYSWDNDSHRQWVEEFARRLRQDGVTAILDRWHAIPGDQLTVFMEREIRESDYVLIVCSPKYKDRSDSRKGGVGYEGDIITGEIFVKKEIRKFIPILKTDVWENSAPSFLLSKFYIDLSSSPYSEENYIDLLATLFGVRDSAPPLGAPPITILKKYADGQKKIDLCNWTKFEFVNLPVFSESNASRTELMRTIRNSLIKVYGDSFKSFSFILSVNSITNPADIENKLAVYSLVGHQRKFILECFQQHNERMTEIITAKQSENWQELKKQLEAKYSQMEREYSQWQLDVNVGFSSSPTAYIIEYDPELKRIKVLSDFDLYTDPKMYENKVQNTSEAIRYICAVCNSPINFLGDIGWHFENLPLRKLLIDLLDHVDISFHNFRSQVENPENWDYVNPRYEAEIKGYS